ncbi:UDP-N-acetyl-alpha-D-glucosamine C6 dehydratase [subsurface metagenome]
MINYIKKSLTIDLFSVKRLKYNIFVFSTHIVIFTISFVLSLFLLDATLEQSSLKLFLVNALPLIISVKLMSFSFFNFKRISLDFFGIRDLFKTSVIVASSSLLLFALSFFIGTLSVTPFVFLVDALITFSLLLAYHLSTAFIFKMKRTSADKKAIKTLIVGTGETSELLLKSLKKKNNLNLKVLGIIDDDDKKIGHCLGSVPILGSVSDLKNYIKQLNVKKVIIADEHLSNEKTALINKEANKLLVDVLYIPSYEEILGETTRNISKNILDINIEDLLKRNKVQIDNGSVTSVIKNKNVLITGAAGSIGSEICRQILKFNPKSLIALDQAETALFYLERDLKNSTNITINPVIADITNNERIEYVFNKYKPDIVFHAAAYKHVPMMEKNVQESFLNNVLGTKVLADQSLKNEIAQFVMISSDKAVHPSSVMGLTKRIAEKYIQSLNSYKSTKFLTIRFGNVLDSSGNVIKIFKEQLKSGGPITVTHKEMKRYFMLTEEAVQLVLQTSAFGNGGDVYLLDMGEPVKIVDLAKSMIHLSGLKEDKDIKIEFTGIRPGEKLFEELSYDDENVCRTHHPKIFAYNSNGHDPEMTRQLVTQIINSVYGNGDLSKVVKKLVPEYKIVEK